MPGQRASAASIRSLSLSHARLHLPAMRLERRSSAPCPGADGQTIGTGLLLTVSCGTSLRGDVIGTIDEATSFSQCADFCSTFHPRCDGVNYSENEGCRLIGAGGADDSRGSRRDDSAVAQYPTLAASTCTDGQKLQATGFESVCSQVINGGDMVQRHQTTFDGCAADCAGTSGCVAFSFESSMSKGFMNCYLKSALEEGAMSSLTGIDSGFLSAGTGTSTPADGGSPIPNIGGFVTIVPGGNAAIQPTDAPGSGAANPLPSGGVIPDSSSPAAGNPLSTAPETEPPVVTRVITVPQDSPSGSAESQSSQGSASLSWVAAPVVGGVAAMLVIGVLVIMFRKKRRNGAARVTGISSSGPVVGGGAGWKSMFGMSGGRGSGSRGMQRLEDDAEGGGVPVYEVKGGKVALRESGDGKQRPMTGLFRTSG